MGDIKIFRTTEHGVVELPGQSVALEKSLQRLIEQRLDVLLGVRFLASEFPTGKSHAGRIDTLGIDENDCPVIIEFKRATNENVINQGLFYLDWLMDHQGEFHLLVRRCLGPEAADTIDWSGPRLLCIAGDFTRYDAHAVQQIDRNIELIRYRRYAPDLLLLELVNVSSRSNSEGSSLGPAAEKGAVTTSSALDAALQKASLELQNLYDALSSWLLALGDDVQVRPAKHYLAYRRLTNFACVRVHPQLGDITLTVSLDPVDVTLEESFTRDIRGIGHHGTGSLEITLKTIQDLEKAKPLLQRSYDLN